MERQREARALSEESAAEPARWSSAVPEVLTDLDRMVVQDARDEIKANPLPTSRGPVGCLVALGGLVLLGVWPTLKETVPVGGFVSPFVVLAGIVLIGGGLFSTLLVGRKTRAAHAAVEAALRQLEGESGEGAESAADQFEREVDLRAAALLVSHAFVWDGPATARTFDPNEVAERIEDRLPLVLAVQNALEEELGAWVPFRRESASGSEEDDTLS